MQTKHIEYRIDPHGNACLRESVGPHHLDPNPERTELILTLDDGKMEEFDGFAKFDLVYYILCQGSLRFAKSQIL